MGRLVKLTKKQLDPIRSRDRVALEVLEQLQAAIRKHDWSACENFFADPGDAESMVRQFKLHPDAYTKGKPNVTKSVEGYQYRKVSGGLAGGTPYGVGLIVDPVAHGIVTVEGDQ